MLKSNCIVIYLLTPLFVLFNTGTSKAADQQAADNLQSHIGQSVFESFQFNDLLPSNSVNRIFEDKEGYIWFGTRDGICRYDGYDVQIFRSSANTPGKLTNNEILCIAEDNFNRIWVGTAEGVNIIDKNLFKISKVVHPLLEKQRINQIFKDREGKLWIATSGQGLFRMDPKDFSYERFSTSKDSRIKLQSNDISNVYEDSNDQFWISTWKGGLSKLNSSLDKIQIFPKVGLNNNPFRVFEDSKGRIWICTWGDGIYHMDENSQLHPVEIANNAKVDNIVYGILEEGGKIWIVCFNGLFSLQEQINGKYLLQESENLFKTKSQQLFHTIARDNAGNLWLGTVGDGVLILPQKKNNIQNFTISNINEKGNQYNVVRMCQTNDGNLFTVFNRIGLYYYDRNTRQATKPSQPVLNRLNSIIYIMNHPVRDELWIAQEGDNDVHLFKQTGGINFDYIQTIKLPAFNNERDNYLFKLKYGPFGNVWLGTRNGLYFIDKELRAHLATNKIKNINDIDLDLQKNIWAGTEKDGLYKISWMPDKTFKIQKVDLNVGNHEFLSIQSILYSGKMDLIYVGTKDGAIFVIDRKNDSVEEISSKYGISEAGILNIIEDDFGMLWISTSKKIIQYNPKTHASIYFGQQDGLLVSSFFTNSCIKLQNGDILFGGNKGISQFSSTPSIKSNNPDKPVVITNITIMNHSLFDLDNNNYLREGRNVLTVDYDENNIGIEFSALDIQNAGKIQYAYQLSGIDPDWNYVGNNRRYVNYANLPPGNYTFLVRSSDENGIWSENIQSLRIEVRPPWFQARLAYLIYFILLFASAYFAYKVVFNRIRLRNELRFSHIEKVKTEELTQIKLRYFTNISHELLTPLTIILMQIEKMQRKLQDHNLEFEMIRGNALRLKRLIKQILVFRKAESGNMKLMVIQDDIVGFVKHIAISNFKPQIEENKINFRIDTEYENYQAFFDPDKLDKVIYNILSNAFKYTPVDGNIEVKISFAPRNSQIFMRLSIADTGNGIPEEDLPHIFERFYISKTADQSMSHGIGLALTYELLQLHKGNIQVVSQMGEGSIFTIEIPVSENSYATDEINRDDTDDPESTSGAEAVNIPAIISQDDNDMDSKINMLVVEDNKELNKLISGHFSESHRIFSAENGLQALQIIKDHEIDLIISDIMMPEMDGLTLCKILKNEVNTSHILILMLTAKNTAEDRIECYNAGADAFIAKPFELSLLEARVNNLIGKLKHNAEKFRNDQSINISSMEYNSVDESFLKLAVQIVEENMADEAYNFDQFSIDMNTSKSTLHRKLKTLTGSSPGEFIRSVRMKHAVQMLNNNVGNISEIAYSVGFSDPKYFSRCFKAEYGYTPKDYIKNIKKD